MKHIAFLFSIFVLSLSACGASQRLPADTAVPQSTLEAETFEAIPTFTPLPGPCATLSPGELKDFIHNSITVEDSGKTFVTHVTSRFWITLDDRTYPLRDLLNAVPDGLIGYVSNGSIRGPQCYPVMFEAVKEGKGLLKLKDFQLSIIIDNALPMSPLPLQ
jgi:hypothetical protein